MVFLFKTIYPTYGINPLYRIIVGLFAKSSILWSSLYFLYYNYKCEVDKAKNRETRQSTSAGDTTSPHLTIIYKVNSSSYLNVNIQEFL